MLNGMEVGNNVQRIFIFFMVTIFLSTKLELEMKSGRHKPGRNVNQAQILMSYVYRSL